MGIMAIFDASDDIVEIVADSGQGKTFSVHRSFLMRSSDYFRAIVDLHGGDDISAFFKSYGPVFVTTEVSSDAISCFVQWLYTGKLTPVTAHGSALGVGNILSVFKWTNNQLHNTAFRDTLVDRTIELVSGRPSTEQLYEILDHLDDADGGMLMFLTDLIVHSKLHDHNLNAEIAERLQLCNNKDLIYQGLAQSFLEFKIEGNDADSAPPWEQDRCQYHEHSARSCCSMGPDIRLAETLVQQQSQLRTPPLAPKKPKRKRLEAVDLDRSEEGVAEEFTVAEKKARIETATPTRVTRSAALRAAASPRKPELRRGRNVPKWTTTERIEALRLYWLLPDISHAQAAVRHNEGYCAARGFERGAQAVGGQYRELMGGVLEETRHLIPDRIAALESELEAEGAGGEV